MQRINFLVSLAFLGTLVLFLLTVSAQASDNPIKFRRYSLAEGLSQGTVSAIVQDKQGFIWVGTQDGLNRFDGYQFKVFRHDDKNVKTLSSDYIQSLFVDEQGILWVGTRKGLNRFHPDTETFTTYTLGQETREHVGSQFIDEIIQADKDRLWIGTMNGLFLFDIHQGVIKSYQHNPQQSTSVSSNRIYALLKGQNDQLWVGTDSGVSIFYPQTEQFAHLRHDANDPTSLSGDNISAIIKGPEGMLWVATYSSGLNRLDPAGGKVIKRYSHDSNNFNSLGHNRVRSLHLDSRQQLWVGTRGGLSQYDFARDRFTNYRNDPSVPTSLSNDHIWAIFEDNNDSLWFATGDGINQFVQNTRIFGHNHKTSTPGIGISHKRVRSLHKTPDGVLWVGADNGLNRYDPVTGLYQYFQHDPADNSTITKGMVMSVLVDSKDRVWAGTYDGGLSLLLPSGKFRQFTPNPNDSNSISHDRVYSIMEDSKGQLWLGTLQGLNRFNVDTGEFKRYFHNSNDPNSLSQDSVYDSIEGLSGDIWVATRNGGLNRLNPGSGKFQRFEHDPKNPDSISHDRVFALYQNSPDKLWLATSRGLNLLHIEQGIFERFGKEHGLLNKTVYAVTGDEKGHLWVSTNRGLARFNPDTKRFKTFTYMHGLQSDEFNNGAYFKAADGELFFGGIDGFNRFYPNKVVANEKPPTVVITSLFLANKLPGLQPDNPKSPLSKVINQTKAMPLSFRDSVFSFEFSALHFISPQDNNYAYMLDGFDEDWTYTHSGHRRATYTNLPSGDYTFRVKAANSDGVWSTSDTTVDINIAPAPWFTWWAYALYFLIIGSTVGAFVLQRWQKQRAILESENRLSLSLWGSGNEFWDWDIAGGHLVRSNNSGEFTMPSGEDFSVGSLESMVHPDDFARLQKAFDDHADGQVEYFECAYRLRNNQSRWIWVLDRGQIVKRDEHGNPTRALGTVQNIDDLKTIEAELRLLNEELENRVDERTSELNDTVHSLEQSNNQLRETQEQLVEAEKMAALGGLVSGIAHEINTPIGICITSTSVLATATTDFFDLQQNQKLTLNDFLRFKETSNESLQLIASNLEKTAYLVQSFKMVSVQQSTDDATDCNLTDLFNQITLIHQDQLDSQQIKVALDNPQDVKLFTHRRSLELLFDQLLNNSINHGFTDGNGGTIEMKVKENDQYIYLDYRDSGRGLPTQGKDKLFEPFYTTERGRGHLGLGMHIIYNHVTQRLGGGIEIDDSHQPGLGYKIKLPIHRE